MGSCQGRVVVPHQEGRLEGREVDLYDKESTLTLMCGAGASMILPPGGGPPIPLGGKGGAAPPGGKGGRADKR